MSNEPASRAGEDGAVLVPTDAAVKAFLVAVAEGYPASGSGDRYAIVENPERDGAGENDPNLVIDTWGLASRTPSPQDGMRKALELARGRLEIYLDTVTELHAKAGDGDPKLAIAFRRDHERFMAKIEGLASSPQPAPDSASPDKVREALFDDGTSAQVTGELAEIVEASDRLARRLGRKFLLNREKVEAFPELLASLPASPRSEDQ